MNGSSMSVKKTKTGLFVAPYSGMTRPHYLGRLSTHVTISIVFTHCLKYKPDQVNCFHLLTYNHLKADLHVL